MKPNGAAPANDGGGNCRAGTAIKPRHDGFTPRKQRRFMAMLAKTGCIRDAARHAPISTTTVDRWRARDEAFDRRCAIALDRAAQHLEVLAWERAVTGIEEPVYYYGKFSHMRVKRSDAIFRMLLMASNRRKYGRMGAVDALAAAEARHKKKYRVASNAEVRAALAKALGVFGLRVQAEAEAANAAHDASLQEASAAKSAVSAQACEAP